MILHTNIRGTLLFLLSFSYIKGVIPKSLPVLLTELIMRKMAITVNETRCEKTGLRGFRPGRTQTVLYSHRRWLEA